jgi:hypothetical protein
MTGPPPAPSARLLVLALALGAALGEGAWRWATLEAISTASGALTSLVVPAVAFVWSVRGHWRTETDSLLGLRMSERRAASAIAGVIERRSLLLAAATLALFGAGMLPFASRHLLHAIWHWMTPLAGASVGAGCACAYIALVWRDAISRAARERKLAGEQEDRDAALIAEATRARPDSEHLDDGWASRPAREMRPAA